jgi:hypothetical protein
MDHYGHHLTRVKLHSFPLPMQQLPCPDLLELVLVHGCSVQLGPAADGLGVVQGCTKLTYLELCCEITDVSEGDVVDRLSSLVHLKLLEFRPFNRCTLSDATLPCLQHLTFLH